MPVSIITKCMLSLMSVVFTQCRLVLELDIFPCRLAEGIN